MKIPFDLFQQKKKEEKEMNSNRLHLHIVSFSNLENVLDKSLPIFLQERKLELPQQNSDKRQTQENHSYVLSLQLVI